MGKSRGEDVLGIQRRAGNRTTISMLPGSGSAGTAEGVVQRWPLGSKDPAKEEAKQKKQEEKTRKREEKRESKARHNANKRAESGVKKRLKEERQIGEAKRAELKEQVSGGADKNDATKMKNLADRFEAKLKEEQTRIEELTRRGLPEENARDQAYEDVWKAAPPDLRALRPARETPAEQLQRELDQFRNEYRTDVSAQKANVAASKRGTLLDTKLEAFYEQQEALIVELVGKGKKQQEAESQAIKQVWDKVPDKLIAKRPPPGSRLDVQARQDARSRLAARKLLTPKVPKSVGSKVSEGAQKAGELSEGVESRVGTPNTLVELSGDETYNASQALGGLGTSDQAQLSSQQLGQSSDILGGVSGLLDSVFGLFSAVSDLAKMIDEYGSGERSAIDIHLVSKIVNGQVTVVNGAANNVSSVIGTVSDFSGDLVSLAASLVPGVAIGTLVTSAVGQALELTSVSVRLARVNGGLYDARSRSRDPSKVDALVSPLLKFQSIFAQKVEKVGFDISATLFKLATSVAELAAAAAWGSGPAVGAILKGATSLVQAAHNLGHWIARSVLAWQSQQGRKAWVGRAEGGAEQLQRNDASTAVDAIVTRARKGDQVALAFLRTYDLTDEQIKKKTGAELHTRLMNDIGAEEDPKSPRG